MLEFEQRRGEVDSFALQPLPSFPFRYGQRSVQARGALVGAEGSPGDLQLHR